MGTEDIQILTFACLATLMLAGTLACMWSAWGNLKRARARSPETHRSVRHITQVVFYTTVAYTVLLVAAAAYAWMLCVTRFA